MNISFLKLTITVLTGLFSLSIYAYDVEINGIFYNLTKKTQTAEVTYKSQNSENKKTYVGNLVIPESVTYDGVTYSITEIGKSAFIYCKNLTSIIIPNSIIEIGEGAFKGCI